MLIRNFAPVLLITLLAACSSSSELKVTKARSEAIRPNATVALSVQATENSGNPEHVQKGVQQVRGNLYSSLPASGHFSQVVPEGQPADYNMEVGVNNVRLVSGSARFWGGAFAGSNVVTGSVKLIDRSNGLEVASFTATGQSASHPISSESGFDDAVREFAYQINEALE